MPLPFPRRARLVALAPAAALLGATLPAILAATPAHAEASSSVASPVGGPAIKFDSIAPARGVLGSIYRPDAHSSDPSTRVTFSIDPVSGAACSISNGVVSFDATGACVIDATQATADGSTTAPAQQSIVSGYARTCAEAVAAGVLFSDGDQTLDINGVPGVVDCVNVATNPTAYVDLANTGGNSNYGTVSVDGSNYRGTNIRTQYTKVALDTLTSQINPNDTTFSTSTGGPISGHPWTQTAWGVAAVCQFGMNGTSDLDLRGTGFTFPDIADQFEVTGYLPSANIVSDGDAHVSASSVSGACASFGPKPTATQVVPPGVPDTVVSSPTIDVAVATSDGVTPQLGQELSLGHIADTRDDTTVTTLAASLTGLAAGNAATYAATGACTVDPTSGTVTPTGAGSCTIIANAPAAGSYADAVPAVTTFQYRDPANLAFTSTPGDTQHIGSDYTPVTTSDNPNPVTLSVADASVCAVEPDNTGKIHYAAKGTCTITATVPGDALHEPGTTTQTTTVLGDLTPGTLDLTSDAKVGEPLTATTAGWDSNGTLAYAWHVDGTTVGTDSATYTPTPADLGKPVSVTVTETVDGYWPVEKTTTTSVPVTKGTLSPGAVGITGKAQVSSTLSPTDAGGSASTWDSRITSFEFVWKANGAVVSDITSDTVHPADPSYTIQPADSGKKITLTVTGSADGYAPVTVTSPPTAAVANLTGLRTGSVQIKGATVSMRAKSGQTLHAATAGWDARATLQYRWSIGGQTALTGTGAAAATFRIPAAAAGKTIGLTVTATRPGYDPVTVSARTVLVVKNPTLAVTYTINGHARRPGVMTSSSHWAPAPVTVKFTCRPGTSAVVACPAPRTFSQGRHRNLTWTVRGTDGGVATVKAAHLNIDTTKPTVSVTRVAAGSVALTAPSHVTCKAHDAVSGIKSCRVATRRTKTATGWKLTYIATATDRAGHRATATKTAFVSRVVITGARWSGGRFHVQQNRTYRVVVAAATMPRLVFAAPEPRNPAGGDVSFHAAGHVAGLHGVRRWVLPVGMTPATRYSHKWNLGIRIGRKTLRVPLYVTQ